MGVIERQKIEERDQLSYEEKVEIAQKSDERCCHCGKKVYFGYGASVEHFVPISKGGTNRDINLVMLCKDCNSDKGDLIYQPEDYLKFLKKEHLDKLSDYFDSYISSFDFVNRKNLLACDCYDVYVSSIDPYRIYHNNKSLNKRYKNFKKNSSVHKVKRATNKDFDKILDYYIKYLKKYDCLDDADAARINILFWMNFGCIYYVEKNNDIKTFISVTVTKSNGTYTLKGHEIPYFLTINLFTYYSNEYSNTLSYNLVRQVPKWIGVEQGLTEIPVKINILKNDKVSSYVLDSNDISYIGDRFVEGFVVLCTPNFTEENGKIPITEDEPLNDFFKKFMEINKENFDKWFEEKGTDTFEWMLNEIALPEMKKKEGEND